MKPIIVVQISDGIKIHAGQLAAAIAEHMGGRGGGNATHGEGGGGDPELLTAALEFGKARIKEILTS